MDGLSREERLLVKKFGGLGYGFKDKSVQQVCDFLDQFETEEDRHRVLSNILQELRKSKAPKALTTVEVTGTLQRVAVVLEARLRGGKVHVPVLLVSPGMDVEPSRPVPAAAASSSSSSSTALATGTSSSAAPSQSAPVPEIEVVDAFQVPRYLPGGRQLFYQAPGTLSLIGSPESKTFVARNRFQLVQQRVKRHQMFSKPAIITPSVRNQETIELSTLESLAGSAGEKFVIGSLNIGPDGCWRLEDLSTTVKINLQHMQETSSGFFTESCVVMARGVMEHGEFQVHFMTQPASELRENSIAAHSSCHFFGSRASIQELDVFSHMFETEQQDATIVLLSDVWLDRTLVLQKLDFIFRVYEEEMVIPKMFIFMGSFLSYKFGSSYQDRVKYEAGFTRLRDLLLGYPRLLAQSHFLFVPGPNDPAPSPCLPRPAIAKCFTKEIRSRISNCTFSSNPCRLRFYDREIVIFREDLLHKLRRHCIMDPKDDMSAHLCKTLIEQAHLCPLPIHLQPVYWEYDHALALYPTPHTLIVGDQTNIDAPLVHNGCNYVTVGPFGVDHRFVEFSPYTGHAEFNRAEEAQEVEDTELLSSVSNVGVPGLSQSIVAEAHMRGNMYEDRVVNSAVPPQEEQDKDGIDIAGAASYTDMLEEHLSAPPPRRKKPKRTGAQVSSSPESRSSSSDSEKDIGEEEVNGMDVDVESDAWEAEQ